MKRTGFYLMFMFIAFIFMPLHAEKVNVERAQFVAGQHLKKSSQLRSSQDIRLVYTAAKDSNQGTSLKSSEEPDIYYYVFNIGENSGFVIISGDDVAKPILGYSDSGRYDSNNLPPNFVYWMDGLQQEIAYAIENQLPQNEKIKEQWEKLEKGTASTTNSPPQTRMSAGYIPGTSLVNTRWDQGIPYNNKTPMVDERHCVTGCVATAMAQIMKYWGDKGYSTGVTTDIPGYQTSTLGLSVEGIPAGTTFDWGNMLDNYVNYYDFVDGQVVVLPSNYNETQANAVAELMLACGVSVQMNYTLGASGAYDNSVPPALINYFGYDKSIRMKHRNKYDDEAWHTILKKEIDAERPVYYTGSGPDGGHAFVCNGYDDDGKFYFNWGWGGSRDGYYVTTALNPGNYTFNNGQAIVTNIRPDQGGKITDGLILFDNLSAKTSVDRGEIFTVGVTIMNEGASNFIGKLGVALVDDDDEIIKVIGQMDVDIYYLGYFSDLYDLSCVVSTDVNPGTHKLRVFAQEPGGEWTIVRGLDGITDILDLTVTNEIIPDNSNLQLYAYNSFIVTPNPMLQHEKASVRLGLINSGSGSFYGEIDLGLYDSDGELVEMIGKRTISISNDDRYNYLFETSEITSKVGNYILSVYQTSLITGERKKINDYYDIYKNDMPITVVPGITWTGTADNNWDNPANWNINAIPGETSIVYIPGGLAKYPELKEEKEEATAVKEIHFAPGAEIGRQDLLSYEKAYVQLDFSADESRNRWYMLSNPLQQLYAGDFSFGGYPGMDMKLFETDPNQGNKAVWKRIEGLNQSFSAGDGFIVWLAPDPESEEYKGLISSEGILELPYFDNPNLADVHWTHSYTEPNSTFGGWKEENGSIVETGTPVTATRDPVEAYRLAGQTVNKTLDFGDGYFAIAGNPYMSSIDFAKLQEENSSVIKGSYHIWIGPGGSNINPGSYAIYDVEYGSVGRIVDGGFNQNIAPMQSFIVEKKDPNVYNTSSNISVPTLTFDLAAIGATDNSARLRSAAPQGDKLNIIASTAQAGVRTLVVSRQEGSDNFGSVDSRKLFDEINSIPEVYTLKPRTNNEQVATAVNILGEITGETLVPLAISTTYKGELSFTFTGMDTYNARISLLDTETNTETELTDKAQYEYRFDYVPEQSDGKTVANESRFFIRLNKSFTGIEDIALEAVRIFAPLPGTLQVVSTHPLRQVTVYNLQGSMVYNAQVQANTQKVEGLAGGVYIVKVVSGNTVTTEKVIVR